LSGADAVAPAQAASAIRASDRRRIRPFYHRRRASPWPSTSWIRRSSHRRTGAPPTSGLRA
jgi:hypothetical protein